MRRMEEAAASGNYEGVDQLLDEDVRFYLPGQSPFAGTYRGINEVVSMFRRANAHRSQHPLEVRVLSLSSSDAHVAERTANGAVVSGESLEWGQTTLYFFSKGKLIECRVIVRNLAAYDAYWSLGKA